MAKVLAANCVAGVVTAGALPVAGTEILSEGIGSSSGVLILEEDKATYVAKTSGDLKATLDDLCLALDKISTILTAIGAGMTGPTTAPPPTLATDVAAITVIKARLTTLKAALK